MRTMSTCLVCLALLAAPGAAARRPWKPAVAVPGAQAVGVRRPLLDPAVRKRVEQRYARGLAELARGRYHQARAALDEVVRLDPDHPGARRALARTLLTLGYMRWSPALVRAARGHALRARALAPSDRELRLLAELIESLLARMQAAPPAKKPAPE